MSIIFAEAPYQLRIVVENNSMNNGISPLVGKRFPARDN
jgi:hypothetical protein